MATHERTEPLPRRYLTGLESAVSGNAQAFGYSILITVTYGVVSAANASPSRLQLLAFALAAVTGLSVLNVCVALLSQRFPVEKASTKVLLIATATDFFAVGLGIGAALGVAAVVTGWPLWPLAPVVAGLVYVLVQAVEFAVGRAQSDES